jgi:hypothetical protein
MMTDEQTSAVINRAAMEAVRQAREQFEVVVESLRCDIQQVAEGHDQLLQGVKQLTHEVRELSARGDVSVRATCGTPLDG